METDTLDAALDRGMTRDILADQVAYWLRIHRPGEWIKLCRLQGRHRRNQLGWICDRVIAAIDRAVDQAPLGMTRSEAAALGYLHYGDGSRPCPKGHSNLRYVSGGNCVSCVRERGRRRYWSRKGQKKAGAGTPRHPSRREALPLHSPHIRQEQIPTIQD